MTEKKHAESYASVPLAIIAGIVGAVIILAAMIPVQWGLSVFSNTQYHPINIMKFNSPEPTK